MTGNCLKHPRRSAPGLRLRIDPFLRGSGSGGRHVQPTPRRRLSAGLRAQISLPSAASPCLLQPRLQRSSSEPRAASSSPTREGSLHGTMAPSRSPTTPATSLSIRSPHRRIHAGADGSVACLACRREEDDERNACSSAALATHPVRPSLPVKPSSIRNHIMPCLPCSSPSLTTSQSASCSSASIRPPRRRIHAGI